MLCYYKHGQHVSVFSPGLSAKRCMRLAYRAYTEGMQLTMYPTYSSNFVSEAGYTKNRIQNTDVNKLMGGVIYGVKIMVVYISAAFAMR